MSSPAALRDRSEIAVTRETPTSLHQQHRTLMRAYQARYIVLPSLPNEASVIAELDRRYDPIELAQLDAARPALERILIAPAALAAITTAAGVDALGYADALLPRLRVEPENPFISFLRTAPDPEPHYRNFLLQSSADLLAEASASAFGVIGAFGAPQSALFRILIDEFGYGAHDRKHSVLYQAVMRDFGLCDAYGAYEALFDTRSLELHNTIHWLFQNPRNVFLQAGFLLFAETAYQRSTADHYRYLREVYPAADARYFGEHAHIDLHHTRIVNDDVVGAYVSRYGAEAGAEIVAGAELTRIAFDRAGAHLLAVSQAFADAVDRGEARYVAPAVSPSGMTILTPFDARSAIPGTRLQVGGLGQVNANAFASFPEGATALRFDQGMAS